MLLDGRFRFENFVVGSANRLAAAAARGVADTPGSVYNPLFLYSSSGLGKTHLLAAIGNAVRQHSPEAVVEYMTTEEFVEQLNAAISAAQGEAFTQRLQRVNVLLLDDVQFLAGRRETQSELLRLFNILHGSGRQIVMSSDRPPAEIQDLDERLITRLAGGLVVDIGTPDYETRVAILRMRTAERGVTFRAGVVEELGSIPYASIRELQGALNKLIAHQSLGEPDPSPGSVRAIVGEPVIAASAAPAGDNGLFGGEFANFLSDVATAVTQYVEPWKARLAEAIEYWSGEGYRVAVLERALQLEYEPDVAGLLDTFAWAVDQLRELEHAATEVDPSLGAHEAFRDPERLEEAGQLVERAKAGLTPPPGPSSAFTRATFETSPANQLAVRAADAVAAEPGRKFNPLFIYGPTGVGKSHLANAIGNDVRASSAGRLAVSCVSGHTFVDELIAALQERTVERWRTRYRAADVLILDDVHFIAGTERTQEELFHLFNALHSAGKQIILTSDRSPKELKELDDRLRSRFEGGLVVPIQPPDKALREKLYARALDDAEPGPGPELLEYLADRPASSVREIIGIAHRLLAAAEVAGVELSLEMARGELESAGSAPAPAPTHIRVEGADAFFLDDEKVVWDWPDIGARIIEELR